MAGRMTGAKRFDAAGVQQTSETNTYDASGNLVASTDARGTTTTFTYDATDLLVSQLQPISASDAIVTTFGYDLAVPDHLQLMAP